MKKFAAILYRHPFWLFLVFLIIAYLPVLLPFFHLKNDILTQNLPTRFVFGESLYSGYSPLWNPYLNYGTPQYGDMNNGFWNPIQWLIGSSTGYNIYTITIEELFYILIGGWGMYKVMREFFDKNIALITGLTYMCCGYLTGHLQYLCWITGTGYFPYVLLYFIRVQKNPILKNFLLGGISVFLFTASTHPGLVIGAGYFFLFTIVIIYFNRNDFAQSLYKKRFWLNNLLYLFISCLLSIVVIVSNIEVLQSISRGSRVSIEQALWAPTTIQSYISTLLPLAVHKSNLFDTDIGMRNVYFGLANLMGFILLFRFAKRKIIISCLIPLAFFVLLSAGGTFKTIAWKVLPFIGHVRLNGEFTYFVVLILLFSGAAGLHYIINSVFNVKKLIQYLKWLLIVCAAVGILGAIISKSSILFAGIEGGSFKSTVKSIIDNCTFWDLLLIQAAIQLITIYLFNLSNIFSSRNLLILSINLIVITWLTLPFTGLGMMSKKEVQAVINHFPRGIPNPELIPINQARYIQPVDENQFMLIASYSKKIGSPRPDQYPVQLNSNAAFVNDTALYNYINSQPFLFLSENRNINSPTIFDSAYLRILKSGPGYTKCIVTSDKSMWLNFLQNDYKYWKVKVDGVLVSHVTVFKTFIGVPLRPGEQVVEFSFRPTPILIAMWVNIGLVVAALMVIFFFLPHRNIRTHKST